MPFSSRFAYVLLQFFPSRTPQQLLPKRRRAERSPAQRSAAQAAPHPASTFCRGALFHNALRGFEFPWACGPPMGMKGPFLVPIDSKQVKRDFRRSVIGMLVRRAKPA